MKKNIFIILVLLCSYNLAAQIVTIPDANFKNALVNFPVVDSSGNGLGDSFADTNGDGEIQVSEAEAIISLIVSYYEIVSLEGIQSFSNLEILKSRGNFVETVDLSQNIQLEWLHLSTNPLISIDVSQNVNLKRLWIYNNSLSSLDVSQNTQLESLRCYTNTLTDLNISNGTNLILENFIAYENPFLECIEVDDIDFATSQTQWQIDDDAFYSDDCNFSINDFEVETILIYPNPVKSILNYTIDNFKIETIQIYNLQGVLLKNVTLRSDTTSIDFSELGAGIYFLKFISEGKTLTKKVIKE
jgi:Leucine-rich repeat (LRR) protein